MGNLLEPDAGASPVRVLGNTRLFMMAAPDPIGRVETRSAIPVPVP